MKLRFPWWRRNVDRGSGPEPSQQGESALRAHHESLTQRARDQHDALADAIGVLERALAEMPRDGHHGWTERVAAELETVRSCMRSHAAGVEEPEGLFDEIKTVQPRLAARAEALQREHESLAARAADLAEDLSAKIHDVDTVRAEAAKLLAQLRSHRRTEADLVYEAFWTELGTGD